MEAVEAIFKATLEGPNALMEIYACPEKAISSLILESPQATGEAVFVIRGSLLA